MSFATATIDLLQPLITKPTLKEKLLEKPPFRFLHDIITNLIQNTGFPNGLFAEDQLNSENVKEKEQKLDFLNRLFSCIQLANNRPFDCSSMKVIAGLEPEKTNAMLQELAQAATLSKNGQLDMAQLVQRVNNGEKPGQGPSPADQAKEREAARQRAEEEARRRQEEERRAAAEEERRRQEAAAAASASASRSAASSANNSRSATPAGRVQFPPPTGQEDTFGTSARLLGHLIQKPKMADKLLRKPPFRFLHDIVSSIVQTTGYGAGYFDSQELNSANFEDPKAKMSFLKKLIVLVEKTNHINLEAVNAKKILAGLEAEQTNSLLQQLAYAAASGVSMPDVIARINNEESGAAPAPPQQSPPSRVEEPKPAPMAPIATARNSLGATAALKNQAVPKLDLSSQKQEEEEAAAAAAAAAAAQSLQSTSSLSSSSSSASDGMNDMADMMRKIERPKTARRAPPKQKSNIIDEKKKEVTEMMNVEGGKAASHVITESEKHQNNENEEEEENEGEEVIQGFESANVSMDKAGRLVRDILEKQKQAEGGGNNSNNKEEKKDEGSGIRLQSLRTLNPNAKQNFISQQQIDELRAQIQKLCQSINPLGKCIDFVYEDMELMNKEMSKWRKCYQEYTERLDKEKNVTENLLQPSQAQLQEVELQIAEQTKKIQSLKSLIIRNEQNMMQLLESKSTLD